MCLLILKAFGEEALSEKSLGMLLAAISAFRDDAG